MDALVAAAIHDAKNALMSVDQQLAEIACRPAGADFSDRQVECRRHDDPVLR